jgi:crossover junction endodeoxyribonuclease RuvC
VIVTGLDLSLTGTGIATIWGVTRDQELAVSTARVGTKATTDDLPARADRLRGLATRIIRGCHRSDLVVVEQPSYGSTGGSAHDRSGLWWLVVASLDSRSIPVVEVAPNTLKVYATGKGRGDKDVMVAAVVRRYGHLLPDLSSGDECDALCLADMGARHLGRPLLDLPADHLRAMKAVRHWPYQPTTR